MDLCIGKRQKALKKSKNIYSAAFTLAEVLIVLGIMGIIAEMVMPGMVVNTQKRTYAASLKKAYSIFAQATLSIANDCGGDIMGCITSATMSADNDETSRKELAALYKAKLKIGKDCTDDTTLGCFANVTYRYLKGTGYKNLSSTSSASYFNGTRMLLSDGTAVAFDWSGTSSETELFTIDVDINGAKQPNQLGKDFFNFVYVPAKKNIIPRADDDCTTSASGWGCADLIIRDGEITYY